ncbi:hypothetical protein RhiTH_001420 [Rhizoctonia solani]
MSVQEPIQPALVRSNSTASSVKSGKLSHLNTPAGEAQTEVEHVNTRPPLDYSSFGVFWTSVAARIRVFNDTLPDGFKGWGNVVIKDGWKYFILAACDVEANFLVVNAGILICIGGMGMLIASDHLTGTGQYPAASMVKGDLFMLAGATLYGFTNATEEFFVRNRPLYEVIGQLGLYGMIINAIQASGLEHKDMRTANWNGGVIGLLFAYTIAMLILYTVAPLIYRAASSVYYNLSLLSSNFYGLLFALGLYHQRPYWLYFIAFVVIIFGLVSYFWHSTPEEQGKLDPQKPEYVQQKPEREPGSEIPV